MGSLQEALPYLEEALELCRDATILTWFAWVLLITSKKQNFYRRYLAQQRVSECCKEALQMQPSALAAQCLAHVEPETLAMCTALNPVHHLVAYGRHCLDGAAAQRRAGAAALRRFLAEVNGPADLPTACLLLGELGATPVTGGSTVTTAMIISSKLMALDALWRYWTYVKKPQRATEASLVAIGALREAPSAWQRAVTMALKALALDGQWDECWRLAAAELSCRSSREILYQCGRLAFYDGREEAISAYLPHMKGMLPAVPKNVRVFLRFWVAMLESKNGYTLVAARTLQELFPSLEDGPYCSLNKERHAKEVLDVAFDLERNLRRIYEASSAVWLSARGKVPLTPILQEGDAEAEAAPPPEPLQGRSEMEHRRPPGWSERPMEAPLGGSRDGVPAAPKAAAIPPWRRADLGPKPPSPELRFSSSPGLGSAWKFFDTWRAARSLKAVEAKDAFLGLLCQGRLHLMNGELEDAQRIWTSASETRVEAFLELWNLHDAQNAHKKAVLCARKAFEETSPESQVSVEMELIFHRKVWGGTAGESVDCRHWVQLLLAKSLRKCSLWEDAWQTLLAASREAVADHPEEARFQGAYGACLYQVLKLCILAAEDAARHEVLQVMGIYGSTEAPLPWLASRVGQCNVIKDFWTSR
ncbi:unnamed protein product [Cladocopium goreaui]|uniref:Tetratricopeptide repeat protein 38 n=1 Tax=Cladocopium goreaui TaxID=2562237 RepID=A0A9P1FFT8_9DINO|nr:unnamed protein product [Cladocopium goreaui]